MKRQVSSRIFMSMIGLCVVLVAQTEPESLTYTLMRIGGIPARLCIGALLGMAVIALVDTLVNDIMPDRFKFKSALRMRQMIWVVMSTVYAGIAFVTLKYTSGYAISLFWILYALFCGVIGYLDLWYEHRDTIEQVRRVQGKYGPTIPGALGDE